jgi:hypothetical protein
MSLRLGIIGPSRRRNGTGEFVARFLAEAGADVVAVAGSSKHTSLESVARLRQFFPRPPYAADSVRDMLDRCALDAVAVCSPAANHFEHLALALDANLHVFCEKPFIWGGIEPLATQAEALLAHFASKQLVVHLNSQWVYTLREFASLFIAEQRVRSFRMLLSPPRPGIDIFFEAAPHPISMLVALGATGRTRDVHARWSKSLDQLGLSFNAFTEDQSDIDVSCVFRTSGCQPRRACYAINEHWVEREIEMASYKFSLRSSKRTITIADPLKVSVDHFLNRVYSGDHCGQAKVIIANVLMLDQLSTAIHISTNGKDGAEHS